MILDNDDDDLYDWKCAFCNRTELMFECLHFESVSRIWVCVCVPIIIFCAGKKNNPVLQNGGKTIEFMSIAHHGQS